MSETPLSSLLPNAGGRVSDGRLTLTDPFMSRHGLAAQRYALLVLESYSPGDRLPPVPALAKEFGVGTGTIQRGIAELEQAGVIELEARGHLGTVLVSADLGLLWQAAGLPSCVGALPLPMSRHFQGLAAGYRQAFVTLGVPVTLLNLHGATDRFQALRDGHVDFVVVSTHTAAANLTDDLLVVHELGSGSYYTPDSFVVLVKKSLDSASQAKRVAIDAASTDNRTLTELEFPDAQYVDIPWSDIPDAVWEGAVDAAVWNRNLLSVGLDRVGFQLQALQNPEALAVAARLSPAAIVARRHGPVSAVLKGIDTAAVVATQQGVVARKLPLAY